MRPIDEDDYEYINALFAKYSLLLMLAAIHCAMELYFCYSQLVLAQPRRFWYVAQVLKLCKNFSTGSEWLSEGEKLIYCLHDIR